ncbi:MAG: PmoA family protein [Planctomycetaceae bacterium]|nr:PmoA family protein [Planctomycetaceae bacterium]
MPNSVLRTLCVLTAAFLSHAVAAEEPALPANRAHSLPALDPKPVPLMQVEPSPHFEARFVRGDRELTRYHFNPTDRRPYLYPLIGPSGLSLSRMGHPHDPIGHSHHNSFWVSHHIVNGVNFWGDRGPKLGKIVPQVIEQFGDTDESAWLIAVNHWIADDTQELLLIERRRVEVRPLPGDEFLTVIDLEFTVKGKPATFEQTPFGLVAVRVRKSMTVHDGSGQIRNSEGGFNEKGPAGDRVGGAFRLPAKWCDYSGPTTSKSIEGVTLFDHPNNPNYPTVFHVRDDGWMGAALTFDKSITVEPDKELRLRYGLWVHNGAPDHSAIDAKWNAFTKLDVLPTLETAKSQPK